MERYTKNLCDLNTNSLPDAGGKGANLGELIHAGLPVPLGFVVTTNAYCAHLEESGLRKRIEDRLNNLNEQDMTAIIKASGDISSWIEEAPVPVYVTEAVSRAFEILSEETRQYTKLQVAVRSSATAEDLPSASFAGQHDTFLGVSSKESVLLHVKRCWISLWTPEAISYRISMNFKHLEVELAVVVQAMIASEAAGVMFTANPVSGNREEILISAGYGLGETVVGGLINPDNFIMTKGGSVKEKILGSKEKRIMLTTSGTVTEAVSTAKQNAFCIGDSELKQLVNLANLVEKHYGSPQDTEWALSNGKIYLLQARPITTMNSNVNASDFFEADGKILIKGTVGSVLLRMGMSWCADPLTPLDLACFRKRAMGAIRVVEKENGCVAVKMVGLHVFPGIMGRFMAMFFGNLFKSTEELWRPLSEKTNASLKKMEAAVKKTNDAGKIAELMEQALNEFGTLFAKRIGILAAPGFGKDFKLDPIVEKTLGKDETVRLEERLLRALPFRTALQNEAMVNLAQMAAENGKNSKAFQKAFHAFLDEYGDRPSTSVTAFPGSITWRENPEFIHGLLDALINDRAYLNAQEGFQTQVGEYEDAKKKVEEVLSQDKIQKFRKSLESARNEVVIREESSFLIEQYTACIRTIALKLGDILAKKSVINERGDIFFLLLEELASAATGRLAVKDRIERRRKSFARVCRAHEKGIHWMVSTGSVAAVEKKKEPSKDTTNVFHGVSASRGVVEGTVCIVRDASEFGKLKKGDVMVSVFTSPAWTPLFNVASAVITEKGSPTSHAAIVAREYDIPAIVALDNMTTVLKDGQKIRVDGTSGVVTLLQKDSVFAASALLQEGGKIHV